MSTVSRKLDHIRICLEQQVESEWRPFDDLHMVHRAIPELQMEDIDTRCRFLGKDLSMPFMICAMTGGHPDSRNINVNLARAAEEARIALGVGSQRAALEHPEVVDTFSLVREIAPSIPVIGNIGGAELVQEGPEVVEEVAGMIGADAVAVHLNFLQELVQPEGARRAEGLIDALHGCGSLHVPVIVKETGAGISREDARMLVSAGISIADVAGVGGTSWSGVEARRAAQRGDLASQQIGQAFWSWGIPTPLSIVECASAGLDVVASGGVRSGLDVARSLALGSRMAGAALPFLEPATRGSQAVLEVIRSFERAFRIAMFLTGCRNPEQLRSSPVLVLGRTREMMELRNIDTKYYANREMSR
ncbi:MAG: Isopentenyl-diphosphate delta-isomerase [Methanosaeta sp. PtaB.Bin039]|nr:MAG: Isopentenyl-diphosphate delta-isomerase [Methanosaeta sp. PtaB.Bin039]HOT07262.1 type 2 isopentenyl-diphosphate Delta-isomerase [Methanotrichaceae archaeon]HQF17290.1 type 2 isopentenyl-diphosphate Delta-isomerase [Methanotrichaceae archaeon]HQI91863.1 type 2 isopentenyl-diphosphate Delta-isomerase [Methanotrichaceae archaeon]HQJ29193.1 type 2 isopentenyl-diphosphate Delta-isomerase [Methanotrichaceae archaeon]